MNHSTGILERPVTKSQYERSSTPDASSGPLNLTTIREAQQRLVGSIRQTPCTLSDEFSRALGCRVYLKRDYLQETGSFKERGACNTLMTLEPLERARGVVAASAGNHALGLALHGARLGVPVTIVMPRGASQVKVRRCRDLGTTVELSGDGFEAAERRARDLACERQLRFVHPFNEYSVMAGQGTLGLEILERLPEVDVLVLPVGGGGLLAGVSVAVKALRPEIQVVAVEPRAANCLAGALSAGAPAQVSITPTLADGLAVSRMGSRTFEVAQGLVDQSVSVSEEEIGHAVRALFEFDRTVVEGAGAVALAGVLSGRVEVRTGASVAVILTGSNVDAETFAHALQVGRRSRFLPHGPSATANS